MSRSSDKPRLRWFQFRLQTLLVLVTVVALGLLAWRVYVAPYGRQRQVMALIERLNGRYQTAAADPWLRNLFGNDFQNLVFVDVADRDPTEYLQQVAGLPCLATLVVGGTSFDDGHLRRLRSISSLRTLVLDTTSVTDAGIAELRRFLRELEVYESDRRACWENTDLFVAKGIANVDAAFELQRLVGEEYFGQVQIVQVQESKRLIDVKCFKKIRDIILDRSDITDADLVHLAAFTKLRSLWVQDTRVTDAGIEHLANLPQLRKLRLDGTKVTDAGLAHLKRMPNLELLSLERTGVTDAGVEHLKSLQHLKQLWLDETQITPQGIAELQRALPECVVSFSRPRP